MLITKVVQRKDTKKQVQSNCLKFAFGGKNKVYTKPKEATKNIEITLNDLIDLIKSDAPSNALKVREIVQNGFNNNIDAKEIKKQIKPYKNDLPFLLLGGYCSIHHNDKDLIYNGCIQIDIDFKFKNGNDKAKQLKQIVKDLDFVVFAAISPSGYGLKVLVSTDNYEIDKHKEVSKALIFDLSNRLNIDSIYFDNLGASQPCFIPFDKDVYFNPNYTKYNAFKALYEHQKHITKEREKILLEASKTVNYSNNNDDTKTPDIEILKYLTNQLIISNIDITPGYENWYKIACSYASCGENARGLFHSVAALNSEYNFNENDKKFNEALKAKFNNIGALVNVCKSYNITINDFCKNWIKEHSNNNRFYGSDNSQKNVVTHHYTLNDKQFISDVLTAQSFGFGIHLLIGGTGVGKTFFTAQKFKKTIVVSRNITTLQNYEKYGFERFLMRDNKDNFCDLGDGSKITVTYKSLKHLLSQLDTSDYVFIFDEYHLLTDSYKDVRTETHYSYDILSKLQQTNIVILSSANDVFISDSKLKIQSKNVFKKLGINRQLEVSYNANFEHLKKAIKTALLDGRKVLLYTNRTEQKTLSKRLKTSFKNNSILFFDATKHNIDLEYLSNDITICTKALTTGKDILNNDLSMIVYCCDYDMKRSTINQFFGRCRNFENSTFQLFFEFKNDNDKYYQINQNVLYTSRLNIAKQVIEASVNDVSFAHENDKYFVKKSDSKMVVNHFAIDNDIERVISKNTIRNTDNLCEFLKLHSYNVVSLNHFDNEQEQEQEQEQELSNIEKYINEIELINNNIDSDSYYFETNAKHRIELLQRLGFTKKQSLYYSLKYDSKMKFQRLINLLLSEKRLTTNDKQYHKDYHKIIECLNDDYLSTNDLIESIKRLRKTGTKIGRFISSIKALKQVTENDKKQILKTLRNYYFVECKRLNKQKLYKISKSELMTENQLINCLLDDILILKNYSDLV